MKTLTKTSELILFITFPLFAIAVTLVSIF